MGVRILTDGDQAVLYCSTTGWAFGPVVSASDDRDAEERLEAFTVWLGGDARRLRSDELAARYSDWLAQEDAQVARERLVTLERDEADGCLLEHEVAELATLRAADKAVGLQSQA